MLTTWHPLSAKVDTDFAEKRSSVGIVRSRTKARGLELFLLFIFKTCTEEETIHSEAQFVTKHKCCKVYKPLATHEWYSRWLIKLRRVCY
jgi:hypothetical protein